jgi:orotate phosphoribosyltransferase
MPAEPTAAFTHPEQTLTDLRAQLRETIAAKGHRQLPEPVRLSSGAWSRDFIDVKAALAHGVDLAQACRALLALAAVRRIAFDAVGGMTMGADQFAHGVAVLTGCHWFVVRKTAKGRGTNQRLEGASVAGRRVLLVEDVATTGGSLRSAHEAVRDAGAEVVLAAAVIDRGEAAAGRFATDGVPYEPILTYRDFGLEPVDPPA